MQRAKTTYQNQFSVFDWIGGSQVNNPGIRSRPRGLKEAVKVLLGGGAGRHHKTEPVDGMCRGLFMRVSWENPEASLDWKGTKCFLCDDLKFEILTGQ